MSVVLMTQDKPEQWLMERRLGIGGSEAAAAVGLSKWCTPYQLWRQKKGLERTIPNAAMRWGNILEPIIRKEYEAQTGRTVLTPRIVWSDRWKFALANIDGVTTDDRLVEIKTAGRSDGWGEPGSDDIPEQYALQVQHYMAVTGLVVCDVAVLISGSDFRLYEIDADDELQQILMDRESEFWDYVERNEPPPAVDLDDVRKRFPKSISAGRIATTEEFRAVQKLKELKLAIAELESQAESCQKSICEAIGDSDSLLDTNGKPLVTWKSAKSFKRFDQKRFEAEQKELYQQYVSDVDGSRRFLVK